MGELRQDINTWKTQRRDQTAIWRKEQWKKWWKGRWLEWWTYYYCYYYYYYYFFFKKNGSIWNMRVRCKKSLAKLNFLFPIKGEVRAICPFWVFDGNGLLGHRLIDSRWFEKNPPTESGWKRRSKKTPTYRYFARKWSWRNMCFQVRAISSRLWFTYIFAFDQGFLSIAGGWRKCDTLLIFCQTVVLVCPLLFQEEQEARVKGFAVARSRKRPKIDAPVSRYMYMNACSRERLGGGTIRPTLSTTWLRRSLASEARRLDAHIHGKLRSTLSPLTKKHIPRRPCCPLQPVNRRSGATRPSRESQLVRSSSFAKKNNEEVSDWYHASKHWLFATLQVYFQVFVPVPVACRRLLRGADCSTSADDRSGPRVADPASISTILEPRMTTKRC